MYRATTNGIRVEVEPFFLPDRSSPADDEYFWAYRVTIANEGREPAQLLSRHWRITDANGRAEEVRGGGVVGEQPRLNPGDSFQYTSGCPLSTPSGIMAGTYTMITDTGERFEAEIPAFSLDSPHSRRVMN